MANPGSDKRERSRIAASTRAERARARAKQERRRRLVSIVATVAAVGLLVGLVGYGLSRTGGRDKSFSASYDASTQVVDFALPAFGGGTVTSTDLRGKPAVINFYASWCEVCDAEMPAFERVSKQAAGAVAFVGVNPQSNDSDGRQADMVKRTGVTYPTARDRNDDLLRLFNTTGGLPTTLFLDAQGKVVQTHNGGYTEQTLTAAITQFLGVTVA
jgi:thiol-disulfide isomerase/thioredoxin